MVPHRLTPIPTNETRWVVPVLAVWLPAHIISTPLIHQRKALQSQDHIHVLILFATSRELVLRRKAYEIRCNARFQVLDQEKHRSGSSTMRFLKPHHLRFSSISKPDTLATEKASRTSTAGSSSRPSSCSSSTSTFQSKIKSKIKSKFTVQNLRSLFHRHSNANGHHFTSASNSTPISISSTPVITRTSHSVARSRNNHGTSISSPASSAVEEVSNLNREAAKPTSPSDAEMLFFLASQHEENLAKRRLQERIKHLGTDTPDADTDSEIDDEYATPQTGKWYRRQPDRDLPPSDAIKSPKVQKIEIKIGTENPSPDLPERSLKRKDHFAHDKSHLQFRYSNSSINTETDRENTPQSQRTYSGISWPISPALSTNPLRSSPLDKQAPSPLLPPPRSSHQRHQKSSSTSSKISGYLSSGADIFDQTRKELQSSLGSTMDLFWREKLIDDSDSDESFFCIGESENGPGRTKIERSLEELDRERRLSGKSHDPWTEGLLRDCRRCEGPNPRGLKGLCTDCELEISRARPQLYDGRQKTHGRESISVSEAKRQQLIHWKVSEMAMRGPLANAMDSRSQRRPDDTVKAIKSFIDHTVVMKSPGNDSHFGIIQDEDGSPAIELTRSNSVRSVKSEPGIYAPLLTEQFGELQRGSSQSIRPHRISRISPLLDSSTVHISQCLVTQGSEVSRDSRNIFEQWQTPEIRAQYMRQDQEYERWSLTLDGDSTVQPVPSKSKFRRPNYSADGHNNNMKPGLKMVEKERGGRWKGKGVDDSNVFYEFQDDAVKF